MILKNNKILKKYLELTTFSCISYIKKVYNLYINYYPKFENNFLQALYMLKYLTIDLALFLIITSLLSVSFIFTIIVLLLIQLISKLIFLILNGEIFNFFFSLTIFTYSYYQVLQRFGLTFVGDYGQNPLFCVFLLGIITYLDYFNVFLKLLTYWMLDTSENSCVGDFINNYADYYILNEKTSNKDKLYVLIATTEKGIPHIEVEIYNGQKVGDLSKNKLIVAYIGLNKKGINVGGLKDKLSNGYFFGDIFNYTIFRRDNFNGLIHLYAFLTQKFELDEGGVEFFGVKFNVTLDLLSMYRFKFKVTDDVRYNNIPFNYPLTVNKFSQLVSVLRFKRWDINKVKKEILPELNKKRRLSFLRFFVRKLEDDKLNKTFLKGVNVTRSLSTTSPSNIGKPSRKNGKKHSCREKVKVSKINGKKTLVVFPKMGKLEFINNIIMKEELNFFQKTHVLNIGHETPIKEIYKIINDKSYFGLLRKLKNDLHLDHLTVEKKIVRWKNILNIHMKNHRTEKILIIFKDDGTTLKNKKRKRLDYEHVEVSDTAPTKKLKVNPDNIYNNEYFSKLFIDYLKNLNKPISLMSLKFYEAITGLDLTLKRKDEPKSINKLHISSHKFKGVSRLFKLRYLTMNQDKILLKFKRIYHSIIIKNFIFKKIDRFFITVKKKRVNFLKEAITKNEQKLKILRTLSLKAKRERVKSKLLIMSNNLESLKQEYIKDILDEDTSGLINPKELTLEINKFIYDR